MVSLSFSLVTLSFLLEWKWPLGWEAFEQDLLTAMPPASPQTWQNPISFLLIHRLLKEINTGNQSFNQRFISSHQYFWFISSHQYFDHFRAVVDEMPLHYTGISHKCEESSHYPPSPSITGFACVLSQGGHGVCAQTDAPCGLGIAVRRSMLNSSWFPGCLLTVTLRAGPAQGWRVGPGSLWTCHAWNCSMQGLPGHGLGQVQCAHPPSPPAAFAQACWMDGKREKKQELLFGITSSQNWEKKRKLNKRDCF